MRAKRVEKGSRNQSTPTTTISNNPEMRIDHVSSRQHSTNTTNSDHQSDNENLQNENPKKYVTTSQKIKSSSLHKKSCSSSSSPSLSYLSSSISSISNSFQKFTPVKLFIGALLLTNTRNSRFSRGAIRQSLAHAKILWFLVWRTSHLVKLCLAVLLAESSILSNTLHHLTLKYPNGSWK